MMRWRRRRAVLPGKAEPVGAPPERGGRPPEAVLPFRLLVVCTGNICRSPMAERLLTAWLDQRDAGRGVIVTSAGTHAMVGEPMTPQAAAIVSAQGGDPAGHVAQLLTASVLAHADGVLVMTREHRSAVARMHPAVVQRVFTLREAGRLAEAAPPLRGTPIEPSERWRELLIRMRAARGSLPAQEKDQDDVLDPFRRGDAEYERCAAQLLPALTSLVDAVTAT